MAYTYTGILIQDHLTTTYFSYTKTYFFIIEDDLV